MKTVKILGMSMVAAEKNGVSRTEYFKALEKVAKWNGLAPYEVGLAIQTAIRKKKEENQSGV